MDDVWIVIPARGGSVGIPRKNVKRLAGKPLIQYVIEVAKELVIESRIVVITDDQEIANFAKLLGVSFVLEPTRTSASETLDTKILRNVSQIRELGAHSESILLTIQPTSPLVAANSARSAINHLKNGANSVVSVVADFHLSWRWSGSESRYVPEQEERKNRQDLEPRFRETGAIIGSRLGLIEEKGTRIIPPVVPLVLGEVEGIDIDNFGDFFQAEHYLTRSRVLIVVDGGVELGLGHVYRVLAIANELSRHEIRIAVPAKSSKAISILRNYPYDIEFLNSHRDLNDIATSFLPDVVVFDVLDTQAEIVEQIRNVSSAPFVITLEDEGPGAALCDFGIYDLTEAPLSPPANFLCGPEFAILGPSFELYRGQEAIPKERNLLITFGGTDPSRLTFKTLEALKQIDYRGSITVVSGPGSDFSLSTSFGLDIIHLDSVQDMAHLIASHEIGVGSRGRTVFEFAAMGVPVLCFAQNDKELRHVHVGPETGSVSGGPGYKMTVGEISGVLNAFLEDESQKLSLVASASKFRKTRSNNSIIRECLKASRLVGSIF